MNDQLHPIFQRMFDDFYPLMKAQTEAEVKRAEEGVAFCNRIAAKLDSVKPIALIVEEPTP